MILFKNAIIHTVSERGTIKGDLLIKDHKIVEIGENISHKDANVIDAEGLHIYPGLIDIHTHLGIYEENAGWAGADGNEYSEPVTPHLRALDAINPDDPAFFDAYANGITTVNIFPGSANIIGGLGVAVKTYGRKLRERIVKEPSGLKMAFGENPKRVYSSKNVLPCSRLGNAALARKTLTEALNYYKKNKKGKKNTRTLKLNMEAIKGVFEGKYPARIHSHRADDIITAWRIMDEFGLKFAIEHCTEGHLIADFIGEKQIPCALGPSISTKIKQELKNMTFKTAKALYDHNVLFAFITDAPVIPVYTLPLEATLAVREGLPEEAAIKAMTINAAKILGVEDRLGSIEKGKEADIVVTDTSILDPLHKVIYTVINGEIVFDLKKYGKVAI